MIRIEEHLGERALEDLEEAWTRLHQDAGGSPFLSHPWVASWHRHLGRTMRPRILTAWEARRLVGLMALAEDRLLPAGLPLSLRRLAFIGEKVGGADYLDVLSLPGREVEITEKLIAHLASDPSFDVLDLCELAADSPILPAAFRHLLDGRGMGLQILPRYVCPQVELQGTWEEVLSRSSRASNFRRRRRQAEALGATYRVVQSPEEAGEALERFLHLHSLRWKKQGGSDGIGTPSLVHFHREVVPALARAGCLRFEELWIQGSCRASIYGLDVGDVYYFYQTGFDPGWSSKSVGLVLLGMSMERAIERGVRVYDFLHGAEPYKLEWATRSRQTIALRVVAKGVGPSVADALEGAAKAARWWAHAILPPRAVERIRRLRRERSAGMRGEQWKVGTQPRGISLPWPGGQPSK